MVSGENVRWMLEIYLNMLFRAPNFDFMNEVHEIEEALDAWWDLSAEEVEKIYLWVKEIF